MRNYRCIRPYELVLLSLGSATRCTALSCVILRKLTWIRQSIASSAAHLQISPIQALVAKDAVFMSGHKFLGGAGTPGLLVVKKSEGIRGGAWGGARDTPQSWYCITLLFWNRVVWCVVEKQTMVPDHIFLI